MAKRIQRKRSAGWHMPEGAVFVGRPTAFGNPFKVSEANCDCGSTNGVCEKTIYRCHTREAAVRMFRLDLQGLMIVKIRHELRGKDLACWCPLDQPCHADILLEIANDPS